MKTETANLLQVVISSILVLVTLAYVVVTWINLKAFQRSVLGEKEARHLDDIKAQVTSPILEWVDHALEILSGRPDVVYVAESPLKAGEPQRSQLHPLSVPLGGFSPYLFVDARSHFPSHFREYDSFRHSFETLVGDITAFGTECCNELWKGARLPPPKPNDRSGAFVDFEGLLRVSFHYLLCGKKPEVFPQPGGLGGVSVFTQYGIPAIANDTQEGIDEWLPATLEYINDRWNRSDLRGRIAQIQKDAENVRKNIQDVQITYQLPNSCRYVGSSKKSP